MEQTTVNASPSRVDVDDFEPLWAKKLQEEIVAQLRCEFLQQRTDMSHIVAGELSKIYNGSCGDNDYAEFEEFGPLTPGHAGEDGCNGEKVESAPPTKQAGQTSESDDLTHREKVKRGESQKFDMHAHLLAPHEEVDAENHAEMWQKLLQREAPTAHILIPNVLWRQIRWLSSFITSRVPPKNIFNKLVNTQQFFWFFMTIIFLNSLWIGFLAHIDVRRFGPDVDKVEFEHDAQNYHVVSSIFMVLFSIEIIIKILGEQWCFLVGINRYWNWFDFIMIVVSIPEIFGSDHGFNMSFARILKVVRMVRVFRLLRMVRALKSLQQMIVSIFKTWLALMWVLVVFVFCIYLVAVLVVQACAMWLEGDDRVWTQEELASAALIKEDFGSLPRTMLSMFSMLTGGDWLRISEPLDSISPFASYGVSLYIFFMTFGIVNVVIGMFCEKAAAACQTDRNLRVLGEKEASESFITEMVNIFKEMDDNKSGDVEWSQFRKYIADEETGHYLRSYGIMTYDARQLFELLDEIDDDASGTMDLSGFVLGMQRLSGSARGTDLVLLTVEFRKFQKDIMRQLTELESQINRACYRPQRRFSDDASKANGLAPLVKEGSTNSATSI